MKGIGPYLFSAVMCLIVFAAVAPVLIDLSNALEPAIVAVGAVAILGRVVWYWTNR